MASAHPTRDMLTAYATGAATEGVSLLVAAHLTYCPTCRAAVAEIESVSGALFGAADAAPLDDGALEATLAQLDAPAAPAPAPAPAPDHLGLPHPVAAFLGAGTPRWRFLMPGVSEIAIPVAGDERVSLLKVRPGAGVPAHTHTAEEATLVFSGSLHDRGRTFGPGDVAIATPDDDHHPRAGLDEECVCLTVLGGSVRFTGTFGRALNIFAE